MTIPETMTPAHSKGSVADLIGGRYRLLRRLGAGGMGEVFRAYDRLSGEVVALKRVFALDDTTLSPLRTPEQPDAADPPDGREIVDGQIPGAPVHE